MFIRFGSLKHRIIEEAYELHLKDDTSSFLNEDVSVKDRAKCLNVNDLEKRYVALPVDESETDIRGVVDEFVDLGVLTWENANEFHFCKEYGYSTDQADIHLIGGLFDVIREGVASHERLVLDNKIVGVPERFVFKEGKPSRAESNALDLLLKFENLLEGIVTFANGDSGFFYSFPYDK